MEATCLALVIFIMMMLMMMMMMMIVIVMMMMMSLLNQAEKQKLDAINQCQRTAAERDEAVQGNKFLQIKLKEAEIALKELGQNVTDSCHPVLSIFVQLVSRVTPCLASPHWRRGGETGRALDLRSTGRGFKFYSGQKLRNNLGQVVHTYVPLSPSSITWYRPSSGDVRWLGR